MKYFLYAVTFVCKYSSFKFKKIMLSDCIINAGKLTLISVVLYVQDYWKYEILSVSECAILPSIPTHLLPCYRNGAPELVAPRRLDVFLSLLRKIEIHTQLDMRMITPALLRRWETNYILWVIEISKNLRYEYLVRLFCPFFFIFWPL